MNDFSNQILPILKHLVECRSITPAGEDAICYIADILSDFGFACEIKKFGPSTDQVTNLYAVLGNSSPNICFAGHVDVVPPGDLKYWNHDPFTLNIQEDIVYGRGVVDMKGAIACFIVSVQTFLKNNTPKGSISFLITSDEEGDGTYGTQLMLKHIKDRYPKIDLCILGEPTAKERIGDTIKIGSRGSANFILRVNGKQGHVAYPESAINPIPIINNILQELSNTQFDSGNEYFQPSNLEFTSVDSGNIATNVIPEYVTAKFNIRFNNIHSADDLADKIRVIIEKYSTDYNLEYSNPSKPFIQQYSDKMKQFTNIVRDICKINPAIETTGGTSDARFIYSYADSLELGLNYNTAHKINEQTKISDLQVLYNVYHECLVRFLG